MIIPTYHIYGISPDPDPTMSEPLYYISSYTLPREAALRFCQSLNAGIGGNLPQGMRLSPIARAMATRTKVTPSSTADAADIAIRTDTPSPSRRLLRRRDSCDHMVRGVLPLPAWINPQGVYSLPDSPTDTKWRADLLSFLTADNHWPTQDNISNDSPLQISPDHTPWLADAVAASQSPQTPAHPTDRETYFTRGPLANTPQGRTFRAECDRYQQGPYFIIRNTKGTGTEVSDLSTPIHARHMAHDCAHALAVSHADTNTTYQQIPLKALKRLPLQVRTFTIDPLPLATSAGVVVFLPKHWGLLDGPDDLPELAESRTWELLTETFRAGTGDTPPRYLILPDHPLAPAVQSVPLGAKLDGNTCRNCLQTAAHRWPGEAARLTAGGAK